MTTIVAVRGWEALDSRGRPTVACRVELAGGAAATALVPSGASAGSHEAVELRDGGSRHAGRGVRRAVEHVNTVLAGAVRGIDVSDSTAVDAALAGADASPGFRELGANAVLSVSLAAALATARAASCSLARWLSPDGPLLLPMPMVNIVSGGAHAGGLLDIQDFPVIPVGARSFAEAIEWACAVRRETQRIALRRGFTSAVLVADEGGLGLGLGDNRAGLDLVLAGIEAAGLCPGDQVGIALDVAATQFYRNGQYELAREDCRLTADELIAEATQWLADFPVVSIEDLLAEDDWAGWVRATATLGERIQLVGDDLFVTDPARVDRGVRESVANAVLVKVNQNGLLRGAAGVVDAARRSGYRTVVSARSGETEDSWLADLAVGWRAGQIKVGSTHRSERTAQWNRLLELEATEETTFAGPWPVPRASTATSTAPAVAGTGRGGNGE